MRDKTNVARIPGTIAISAEEGLRQLCGSRMAFLVDPFALTLPSTFEVLSALFPVGFDSNADFITVTGKFAQGTIVAPLSLNIEPQGGGKFKVTPFDTSWTNAGFVNIG